MENIYKAIGERVRDLRKQKGWGQEKLGEYLGVEKGTISKYETGETRLSIEAIITLAKLFEVSTNFLLTGEENTPAKDYQETAFDTEGPYTVNEHGPEPGSLTYDGQLLLETVLAVEKLFDEEDLDPTPEDRAKIIESIYEMSLYRKHLMSTKEIRKILRLVG